MATKAAQSSGTGGNGYYTRDVSSVYYGTVSCRIKINITNPNGSVGPILEDTAVANNGQMFIKFGSNGYIQYWDGGGNGYQDIVAYDANTWYTVYFNFDVVGHANKYRVKVEDGEWTAWTTVNASTYSKINRFRIRDLATNAHTFSLDSITGTGGWTATEDFESYTLTDDLDTLNGGSNWSTAWSQDNSGVMTVESVADPTEVIRYVDPDSSGGDGTTPDLSGTHAAYASLSAWNTAEATDITFATGSDELHRVICASNQDGGSGSVDSTPFTMNAWTTGEENPIIIEANTNHGALWNDNIYRHVSTTGTSANLRVSQQNVRFIGIQFFRNLTSQSANYGCVWFEGVSGGTHDIRFEKCIFKLNASFSGTQTVCGVTDYSSFAKSGTAKMHNCIFYDFVNAGAGTGRGVWNYGNSVDWDIYNNTFQNCDYGIYVTSNVTGHSVKNNLFKSCTTDIFGGDYKAGSGYNSTSNASLTYTVSGSAIADRVSQTITFLAEGSDDFRLAASDTGAKGCGVPDPSAGIFTDDAAGQSRPSVYLDRFNRDDADPAGSPWYTSPSQDDVAISTMQLKGSIAAAPGGGAYHRNTFGTNQFAQATIDAMSNVGLIVRTDDTVRSYYRFQAVSSTIATLGKYVSGTWTQIGTDISGTYAATDVIRLEVIGTGLYCFQNGTLIRSDTDSDLTEGFAGVRFYDSAASRLDDFSAGQFWDIGACQAGKVGFVEVAQVIPQDLGTSAQTTNMCFAQKFTCPGVGGQQVTEIGGWLTADSSTTAAFRYAIFTHDAVNNKPEAIVYGSDTGELYHDTTTLTKVPYNYVKYPRLWGGDTYWVAWFFADNNGNNAYLTSGGTLAYTTSATYPTWPTGTQWEGSSSDVTQGAWYVVLEDFPGILHGKLPGGRP